MAEEERHTVLKSQNESSYGFALGSQKTVLVVCSLGRYESYDENGLMDPLGHSTEEAMLAAPSTLTHIYTPPQDTVMLVVAKWCRKRELGHLDAVLCKMLIGTSENFTTPYY